MDIPPPETEPHLLISSVRQAYFKFLVQLISQNYVTWCGEKPPIAVYECAKQLELSSATKAMVVPLYREAVLDIIKKLKAHTHAKELHPELEILCLKPRTQSKAVQTDCIESKGTNNFIKHSSNNVESGKFISEDKVNSSDAMQVKNLPMNDNVMAEMERLFQSSDTHISNDDDIFDSLQCDKQEVEMILNDLNKFMNISNNQSIEEDKSGETQLKEVQNPVRCSEVSSSQVTTADRKYLYSPWPCELYYQKKRLREKLDYISEESYRRHFKIKKRFIELFGCETDDEQELQSPDTSTDFIRSCRQRAAPYLTKHLRKFSYQNHVPKHLLKPLAKHLLYNLINYNQYASDYECYKFVRDYFKSHTNIRCTADF